MHMVSAARYGKPFVKITPSSLDVCKALQQVTLIRHSKFNAELKCKTDRLWFNTHHKMSTGHTWEMVYQYIWLGNWQILPNEDPEQNSANSTVQC